MEGDTKTHVEPEATRDSKNRRYQDKLTYEGKRLCDPYSEVASDTWSDDVASLPPVTHPDVFVYCALKTEFYAPMQLKAYKSLEAFKYVKNGSVQELWTANACDGAVFLKTEVLSSQGITNKSKTHLVWVLCTTSGDVVTAHCTCMTRPDDEMCCHVAAVLFKTQEALIAGLRSGRMSSEACPWFKVLENEFGSKVKDIQFDQPGRPRKRKAVCNAPPLSKEAKQQIEKEVIAFGKKHGAVFMTSISETPRDQQE